MTEVQFLSSVQGYQGVREQEIADRLKKERADLSVRLLSPEESAPVLQKYKLKFGPAVVIDDRLEFIGIPRYRMLVERIEISRRRAAAPPAPPANPTSGSPGGSPGKAAPTAKPAAPERSASSSG